MKAPRMKLKFDRRPLTALLMLGLTACNEMNPQVGLPVDDTSSPKREESASQQPANNSTPSGGVIDSSGGNLQRSSEAEVARALEQLPLRLQIVSFRMKAILEGLELSFRKWNGEQVPNRIRTLRWTLSEAERERLREMLGRMTSHENLHQKTAYELIRSGFVKIQIEKSACHSKEGPSDASATTSGKICISKDRVSRIDPSALAQETTALALHELTHVFGYNEADAELFQKFFLHINYGNSILLPSSQKRNLLMIVGSIIKSHSSIKFEWGDVESSEKTTARGRIWAFTRIHQKFGSLIHSLDQLEQEQSTTVLPLTIQDLRRELEREIYSRGMDAYTPESTELENSALKISFTDRDVYESQEVLDNKILKLTQAMLEYLAGTELPEQDIRTLVNGIPEKLIGGGQWADMSHYMKGYVTGALDEGAIGTFIDDRWLETW